MVDYSLVKAHQQQLPKCGSCGLPKTVVFEMELEGIHGRPTQHANICGDCSKTYKQIGWKCRRVIQ